jgi:hypothetical protein
MLIKLPMHMNDGDTPIASFPFPDHTITTFEFVQRIDWSSFSCTHCLNTSLVDDSVSFFWHLVQITPDLRYLSLVGSYNFTYYLNPALFSDMDSCLFRVRVLGLESMIWGEWNLPSLIHLVTDNVSHSCGTDHDHDWPKDRTIIDHPHPHRSSVLFSDASVLRVYWVYENMRGAITGGWFGRMLDDTYQPSLIDRRFIFAAQGRQASSQISTHSSVC